MLVASVNRNIALKGPRDGLTAFVTPLISVCHMRLLYLYNRNEPIS